MTCKSFTYYRSIFEGIIIEQITVFKAWMWYKDRYIVGTGKSHLEAIQNALTNLALTGFKANGQQ
jgi:hypothetical protein